MNLFPKYPNKYFVETGTCTGGGVLKAIESGFKNIRSIELSDSLYEYSKALFKDNPNVILYKGDSTLILWDVIKDITEPITFFLDGHASGGITTHNFKFEVELKHELRQIAQHPIKTHTILIDDYNGYQLEGLQDIILKINPDYKFSFDTYADLYPGDVLVAQIK